MKLTGNTIVITGGGSGIGRGLAEAFHALGNKVIVAGRRKAMLDDLVKANPGIAAMEFDITDRVGVREFAAKLVAEHPKLNVVINNAGIMRMENLLGDALKPEDAEATVATNLLGPIRLTTALLPQLRKQDYAAVMNVSSGLAFLPLAPTPTYSATKAALHSYTESLRYQLQATNVEVLELIPPYVATDLMNGASDPRAMPLDKFIAEAMEILKTQPEATEICVEDVKMLRFAAESGKYSETFKVFNDAMAVGPH